MGRRNIVGNSSNGHGISASLNILPCSKKPYKNVGRGTVVEKLRNEVQVGNKGGLKNDRHVGSVEEFDGVSSLLSTVFLVFDRKVNTPSLEVDNNNKDEDGGHKICKVGKILTVESFPDGTDLVFTSDEKMEKSNDGSLELSSTPSVDGGGTECFPDNVLTDVGSDEKTDTTSQTVSLLQKLIENQDYKTSEEKLDDDEDSITKTDGSKVSIHSTDDVGNGLSCSDQNTEKLLGSRKQGTIFLYVVVNLDNTTSSKKLHDKTRCYNRTDSKFHKSSTVGSEDNTHPVERITGFGALNTIDRNLTAHKENEQSNGCPKNLFSEWDLLYSY